MCLCVYFRVSELSLHLASPLRVRPHRRIVHRIDLSENTECGHRSTDSGACSRNTDSGDGPYGRNGGSCYGNHFFSKLGNCKTGSHTSDDANSNASSSGKRMTFRDDIRGSARRGESRGVSRGDSGSNPSDSSLPADSVVEPITHLRGVGRRVSLFKARQNEAQPQLVPPASQKSGGSAVSAEKSFLPMEGASPARQKIGGAVEKSYFSMEGASPGRQKSSGFGPPSPGRRRSLSQWIDQSIDAVRGAIDYSNEMATSKERQVIVQPNPNSSPTLSLA